MTPLRTRRRSTRRCPLGLGGYCSSRIRWMRGHTSSGISEIAGAGVLSRCFALMVTLLSVRKVIGQYVHLIEIVSWCLMVSGSTLVTGSGHYDSDDLRASPRATYCT